MITITLTADCSKSLVSPRLRGDSATGAGALSMSLVVPRISFTRSRPRGGFLDFTPFGTTGTDSPWEFPEVRLLPVPRRK